ncbi:MAG: preQ(1) synthase [Chthoniobacterales bacterium]
MAKPRKSKNLTLLGRTEAKIPSAPSAGILETFASPTRRPYWIRFESSDFTSLCPITGQADFASIQIDYQPGKRCLETKSLKFYLASYRNQRAFNEAVTNRILEDLVAACKPRRMTVRAEFASRGGIALTITVSHPEEADPAEA